MIAPHTRPDHHRGDVDLDAGTAWLFTAWVAAELAGDLDAVTPEYRAWLRRQADRLGIVTADTHNAQDAREAA